MNRSCPRSPNQRSLDRSSTASATGPPPAIETRFLFSHIEGDVLTLQLSGDLDASTASLMRGALRDAENLPVRIVSVDAGLLGLVDATGLGTLVGGYRRLLGHDIRLEVIHTSESIRRVIVLVGFEAALGAA